jgi:hypothetical protein
MKPGLKPYLISIPTLLVPGLSHFLLGKKRRGAAFFFIVSLTFLLGIMMSGGIFTLKNPNWLYRLAGIGELGMGVPYFLSLLLGVNAIGPETVTSVMFGYGSTFLISAGLMNMLLMMDAFDIAIGRKVYD